MSTWKRDDDAPLSGPRPRHARALIPRPRALLPILLTALAASMLTYAMSRTPRTTRSCETAASPGMTLVPPDVVRGLEDVVGTRSVVELTRTVTVKAPAQTVVVEVEKLVNASVVPERSLKGPPTPFFRDNLLPDRKYITTFHDAGWTNQVMMVANMIFLALQTSRIPILPQFAAIHHLGASTGSVAFAEVFDVPRLAQKLGREVLDWTEVKDFPTPSARTDAYKVEQETLGCWSSWAGVKESNGETSRAGYVPELLGLDISWTPVPESATLGHDSHVTFWGLSKLSYPDGRRTTLDAMTARTTPARDGSVVHPDDQLMCLDFLYFACAHEAYEWEKDWSPVWNSVLTHLRWTPRLQRIIDESLLQVFGLPSESSVPPYIAVHVRHGDFTVHCPGKTADECFTPLSDYANAVDEMRTTLKTTRGIDAREVLVASDETSDAWWAQVAALGWRRLDHGPGALNTGARLGRWYEVFIDAGALAGADGLVGTQDSTMSLLALRRVHEWRGGVGRMVAKPNFYD